jgi:hypothetical protein
MLMQTYTDKNIIKERTIHKQAITELHLLCLRSKYLTQKLTNMEHGCKQNILIKNHAQ